MLVSSMGPASSPCSLLQREQSSLVSVFACFAALFSLLFVHVCLRMCVRGGYRHTAAGQREMLASFSVALRLIFDAVLLSEPGSH